MIIIAHGSIKMCPVNPWVSCTFCSHCIVVNCASHGIPVPWGTKMNRGAVSASTSVYPHGSSSGSISSFWTRTSKYDKPKVVEMVCWIFGHFGCGGLRGLSKLTSIGHIDLASFIFRPLLVDPEIHQIFLMKDFSRISEHRRTGDVSFFSTLSPFGVGGAHRLQPLNLTRWAKGQASTAFLYWTT